LGLWTAAALIMAVGLSTALAPAEAQSLRGSRTSVERQRRVARDHDLSLLRDPAQVRKFVELGLLVPVPGNADYELAGVSFPYARPATRLFVERLAAQYHAACGEKLVITSLTRPLSHQPRNASDNSVHPAGIAVDIRRSDGRTAQRWLEKTLLYLEGRGVLEATKERHPPHYHVAVFPDPYETYVAGLTGGSPYLVHRVRSGDSLWTIARHYGCTVEGIQRMNGITSTRIRPGQDIKIPGTR
jgi:hypothetical protein